MARHGVSIYRAVEDRRARWAEAHPREARICSRIQYLGQTIRQWRYQVEWADSIMERAGRVHNEKSWAQRMDRERKLVALERLRGAWELRLKEVA